MCPYCGKCHGCPLFSPSQYRSICSLQRLLSLEIHGPLLEEELEPSADVRLTATAAAASIGKRFLVLLRGHPGCVSFVT